MIHSIIEAVRRVRTQASLVVSVALVGLTASFAMWNPLAFYERGQVSRTTAQSMRSLRADLISDMQARLLAQIRLAELLGVSFTERDRTVSSRLFLEHHAGYLSLEWAGPSGRVQCAVSRDGRVDPDLSAFGTERVLEQLRLPASPRSAAPIVTPSFALPGGRQGLRVIVPVVRDDAVAGFLVAVVDVHEAFDSMLDDHKDLGYAVAVAEGSSEIYRMAGDEDADEPALAEQGVLRFPGTTWTVRVWPKRQLLTGIRSWLPRVAMVLGGLLGAVLMLAVHFGRAARHTSRELQQAHHQLEQRVKERTTELEQVSNNLRIEVADRKRAEDSYRDLSARLLRLQDEERRRLARELHDSTAQMLGALAINVGRAQVLAESRDLAGLQHVLAESVEFVGDVTQEIRTVSYLLHPPMLDELGMEYVLPWYANGFSQRSGIEVSLDVQKGLGRLPYDIELTLFRIVQEALGNVHRHSASPNVAIALFRSGHVVTLEICDEGCGLPSAVLAAVRGATATAPIGVGIAGMRERVRQLHGCMEIQSDEGGTTIRALLPLAQPDGPSASCCGPTCVCPVCGTSAATVTDDVCVGGGIVDDEQRFAMSSLR